MITSRKINTNNKTKTKDISQQNDYFVEANGRGWKTSNYSLLYLLNFAFMKKKIDEVFFQAKNVVVGSNRKSYS